MTSVVFQMADFPECPDCGAQDWQQVFKGQLHDYDETIGEWSLASLPTGEDIEGDEDLEENSFVCRHCHVWIYEEENSRLWKRLINRGGTTRSTRPPSHG